MATTLAGVTANRSPPVNTSTLRSAARLRAMVVALRAAMAVKLSVPPKFVSTAAPPPSV
jgi:hypothetical protein